MQIGSFVLLFPVNSRRHHDEASAEWNHRNWSPNKQKKRSDCSTSASARNQTKLDMTQRLCIKINFDMWVVDGSSGFLCMSSLFEHDDCLNVQVVSWRNLVNIAERFSNAVANFTRKTLLFFFAYSNSSLASKILLNLNHSYPLKCKQFVCS